MLRSAFHPELKERLRSVLLKIGAAPPASLTRFGLVRFAPVTYERYAPEGIILREYERVFDPQLR